jgi:hypothetical protein
MAMAVTPEKRTAEALTYIPLPRFLPTRMLLGMGGGGGAKPCWAGVAAGAPQWHRGAATPRRS